MDTKKHGSKDYAHINGACKLAKLSEGYQPRTCPRCGTSHKLKKCPWCGYIQGKKC